MSVWVPGRSPTPTGNWHESMAVTICTAVVEELDYPQADKASEIYVILLFSCSQQDR